MSRGLGDVYKRQHQDIFRDYEVVKGGMDDVFLAVTGKVLGGENE